jgi:hypothetical protein
MDDLVYAKFISKEIGYGLFAKTDLKKGTILG